MPAAPIQRSPLPAASAAVLQNLLRRVLDSGVAEAVDVIWPKADNIDYWYNIYAFPEFDREGRVVSVMTVSRDITERKRAEEDLRRMNERFALATNAARLGVWDWDIQKNELVWDDGMYALYGIKREDFAGAYEAWLKGVHPDDRARSDEISKLAQRGEREYDTEFRVVWPDGSVHYLKAYGQIVRDADGRPLRMTGINFDITERKRAEEELRQYREHLEDLVRDRTQELEKRTQQLETANIRLREADRLKSVFLASMSHELRTPLNSIIGFTGIMLMGMTGKLSEEQHKQLMMVKNSANHLLGLINDVLDIAKIEAGRVTLSLERFEIGEVVDSVIETVSPMAAEKGLELVREVPSGLTLTSDKRRVKQILLNIIGNAVKFTEHGNVTISAAVSGDKTLELRFTDTGIGIKEEDMKKLFSPFQQIDVSLTKAYEGTGLGLYLCKRLASLLGGDIVASSRYGKGSEFTVVLPVACGGPHEKDIGG